MNPLNRVQQLIKISLVVASLLLAPIAAIAAEMVDINRADAATMIENWKGIGEKKADAIVSYRKKNGNFASIEDLANVTGIGEGLIKNNRKYMSVSKGAYKPTGKTTSETAAKKTTKSTTDTTTKTKPAKKSSDSKTTTSKSTDSKSKDTKTSTTKKDTSKKSTKDSESTKKSTSKTKKKSSSKTKKKACTAKSKTEECKKKKKAKTS